MKTLTLDEFFAELKAQDMPREHIAFRCPICGTIQSAADLITAGAGADVDAVTKYVAFSCVGRWTGAGPYRPGDSSGRGCDWTLGGLLSLHKLEVVTPDGKHHPRFELASPADAKAHMAEKTRTEEKP